MHVFEYDVYVKDLTVLLNGRSFNDIIIVDNKLSHTQDNLENGIPIISFMGEQDDTMLMLLEKYLL